MVSIHNKEMLLCLNYKDLKACGGLNENGPYGHIYSSTWFPNVGTIWEGLGGITLLKQVCNDSTL